MKNNGVLMMTIKLKIIFPLNVTRQANLTAAPKRYTYVRNEKQKGD